MIETEIAELRRQVEEAYKGSGATSFALLRMMLALIERLDQRLDELAERNELFEG